MTGATVAAPPGPAAPGRLEGGRHLLPIRVYYEDTDASGIVYHANYLRFAERARTEMLRLIGIDQSRLRAEQGLAFAVRDCSIDFRRPARLDDLLEVRTRLLELTAATLRAEQLLWRGADLLVRIAVRVACVNLEGRAARLPRTLREALEPYLDSGGES